MAKVLIEAGADINEPNSEGYIPVDYIQMVLDHEVNDDGTGEASQDLWSMSQALVVLVPVFQAKLKTLDPPAIFGQMLWIMMQIFHECGGDDSLLDYVNLLLEAGGDPNYVDTKSGFSILHHLLNSCKPYEDEDAECEEEEIWSNEFNEDLEEWREEQGLEDPSRQGFCLEILDRLAKAKLTLNVGFVTASGKNLLHYAAFLGYSRVAARLMEIHAACQDPQSSVLDINAMDSTGMTPLHTATRFGEQDMVNLLIARGANVLVVAKGQTPFEIAATADLSALLGSNTVRTTMQGITYSVLESHPKLVSHLIERMLRAGPTGKSCTLQLLPSILSMGAKRSYSAL